MYFFFVRIYPSFVLITFKDVNDGDGDAIVHRLGKLRFFSIPFGFNSIISFHPNRCKQYFG